MAPDWEKLSAEWEGNEIGFVAEVDCTAAGKPLCDANGVKGFPTLKYGDPSSLSDYQGGRSFDALAKFATENLKPICSPAKIELCDDEKKAKIEELMAMSDADISTAIEDGEKKIAEADDTFKAEVQKLQEKYQSLMQEKDDAVAAVTESGLGLLKSVQSYKAKAAKDEL